MEITAALGAAGSSATGAAADQAGLAETFDDFLKLLITQLKYQNPLEPMDSNAFVAQLVQFTEVEQSISSNKKLEQLLELQSANQSVQAIGYIGRTIEAAGDTAPLGANGIEFTYTLDGLAESSLLVVLDANNQVVTSTAHAPLTDAMRVMKEYRIRHLPVLDDEQEVIGIISMGDIVKAHHDELATENHCLRSYIQGEAADIGMR